MTREPDRVGLEHLLEEYIRRREAGEPLTPHGFAAEHPEHSTTLRHALDLLEETERFFGPHPGLEARIGRFRVVGEVGRGGMAQVLEVEDDRRPDRRYALKMLHTSQGVSERSLERFRREGEILQRVDHPGVVHVEATGVWRGKPFVVMELVAGVSLARILESRTLEPTRAARLAANLARALEVIHHAGLVHRDIKPDNIVVTPQQDPVLLDFGLAAVSDAPTLTRSGELLGTPHYMSPEQARGSQVDGRSDIYALGAVLYRMLGGVPPHGGASSVHVLDAVRRRPITPIRRIAPEVPRPLAVVLERTLAFHRSHRYASATMLADDLEAFCAGRPIGARPDRLGRGWHLARYRLPVIAPAAAILLAVIIGLLAWASRRANDPGDSLLRAIDRAALSWAAGDIEETRQAAQTILRLDPDDPQGEFLLNLAEGTVMVDAQDAAVDELIAGESHRRAGQPLAAIGRFQRAVRLAPDSPLPVIMLGRAMAEAGRLQEQENGLRLAVESHPFSAALHRQLADRLYRRGAHDKADLLFARALELAPDSPRLYFERARNSLAGSSIDAGLATARAALSRFGSPRGTAVFSEFAALLDRQTQRRKARELWHEILEIEPENAQIHFLIGASFDADELLLEALEWYAKALALDPAHLRTLVNLAHLHAGANRETCAHCKAFFQAHPDLYDPELVERYARASVAIHEGKALNYLLFAVDVCKRVGRTDALRRDIEARLAEAGSNDQKTNLSRALTKLGDE